MIVLVVILIVTNVAALVALGYLLLRPADEVPGPDPGAAAALDRSPAPASTGGTRRLISIEILNPIELAGTRGRLAGLAGSLAPGFTRRIVYDQTLKIVKQQLEAQHVVADVRLHTLRPVARAKSAPAQPAQPAAAARSRSDFERERDSARAARTAREAARDERQSAGERSVAYADDVQHIDLDAIDPIDNGDATDATGRGSAGDAVRQDPV